MDKKDEINQINEIINKLDLIQDDEWQQQESETLEEYNEAKKRGVKNIAIIFKDLKYDIKVENLKSTLINEEVYNYKTDLELVNAIKSIINTKLEV